MVAVALMQAGRTTADTLPLTPATVNSPDGLNLRSGPDTTYEVVTALPAGAQVMVVGAITGSSWLPVQYGGQDGWADAAYLSMAVAAPVAATTPAVSTARVLPLDGVHLRDGPGLSYGVLATVPAGTTVTVSGSAQGGWAPVSAGGVAGWVDSAYIALIAAGVAGASAAPSANDGSGSRLSTDAVAGTAGADLGAAAGQSSPQPVTTSPAVSNVQGTVAWPVAERRITTVFSAAHLGLDIAQPPGSGGTVWAAAAGTVSFAGGDACCSYGLYVVIDHANGMQTLYAHLSRTGVKRGQLVAQGAEIGRSGSTGHSTAAHLHFELHLNGKAVDPLRFLPPPWQIV